MILLGVGLDGLSRGSDLITLYGFLAGAGPKDPYEECDLFKELFLDDEDNGWFAESDRGVLLDDLEEFLFSSFS